MSILKNKMSSGAASLPLPKMPMGSTCWPAPSLRLCLGFFLEGLVGVGKLCQGMC